MITRIEALNYRSLRYIRQRLSPFQTLVGPNGSGKSTFLDVIDLLGDILKYGLARAIKGEGTTPNPRAADPSHLCWMRQGEAFELALDIKLPDDHVRSTGTGYRFARYEVRVEVGVPSGELRLAAETLWLMSEQEEDEEEAPRHLFPLKRLAPETIVIESRKRAPAGWRKVASKAESGIDYFRSEKTEWNNPFRLGPQKSALANLPEDEDRFPSAIWVKRFLMEGVHKVVLNAEAMRRPSPPGSPTRYLPNGSNLPWVVHGLRKQDPERFERWVEHFKTAIPDLKTVDTVEREEDRHRYLVVEYENGLKAPSWVVSDGTLRLLALTLLAYVPDVEGVFLIEEPENGVHPRAVETVFQSLSSVYGAQVMCASHSPVVLGLATPASLLCFGKDEDGATDIVRGDEHPALQNWQGTLELGTLFASGVLG